MTKDEKSERKEKVNFSVVKCNNNHKKINSKNKLKYFAITQDNAENKINNSFNDNNEKNDNNINGNNLNNNKTNNNNFLNYFGQNTFYDNLNTKQIKSIPIDNFSLLNLSAGLSPQRPSFPQNYTNELPNEAPPDPFHNSSSNEEKEIKDQKNSIEQQDIKELSNSKLNHKQKPLLKENYLDLLISAIENYQKNPEEFLTKNTLENEKISIEKCENKLCQSTLDDSNESTKPYFTSLKTLNPISIKICGLCLQAYNKGQYCYYCGAIYRKGNLKEFDDHKSWVGCDFCNNWEHINCEENYGNFPNLSTLIHNKKFKYKCPFCFVKISNLEKEKANAKKEENLLGKKIKSDDSINNYINMKFIFQNDFNKDEAHHKDEIAIDIRKLIGL